eukprot:4189566-Prymnesium_polylepis.1
MGCGASTAASGAKAVAAQPVKPRTAPDPPPAAATLPPVPLSTAVTKTTETSSTSTQAETSNLPKGEKATEAHESLQMAKRRSLSSAKFSARVVLWWKCFLHKDPRRQILQYFQPGDVRGPRGYLAARGLRPEGPPSRCDASK